MQNTPTTLAVNGTSHPIVAAPETPLLWVLRDIIGLTGTKYGCGQGQCGACTVLLDGRAVRSCVTPVSAASGRVVTTIEVRGDPLVDALRAAWAAEDVPQCGYCQPGQVMASAALLRNNPAPSPDEIGLALRDNICRCGTYVRIRRAVSRAAAMARGEDSA